LLSAPNPSGAMALEGMNGADTAWVLMSSALVLLMTPGLAFFYGGLVQGSNVLNTMMMSIISMGVTAVSWVLVGFSLSFGSKGGAFIGDFSYIGLSGLDGILWPDTKLPAILFAVFQTTFVVIAAAIISGAVAERMKFSAYVWFICLWSLLIYAPVCHWVWGPGGWIDGIGVKDFAGGNVVHLTTGVSSLVLAILLGPRLGHGESRKPVPHSIPFAVLGAALLWFGWSGFNGGSALAADETAALALVNTYAAPAASLVTWALLERLQHKRSSSATGMVTGAIVGLVIITPAAAYVSPVAALLMGACGCVLVYPTFQLSHHRVDDSLDAFPCHGVSSFVGACFTGIFARDGGLLYGGGLGLIAVQVEAALATATYTAAMTAAIFFVLSRFIQMRVAEEDESLGLDNSCHGEVAYGDHANGASKSEGEVLSEDAGAEDSSATQTADLEAQNKTDGTCSV